MKSKEKQTAMILVGIFAIMYLANAWMPLYRDDYLAAVIWRTGDHLQSMSDVFYSLERYYFMHGGRLVSFFVQFVFMLYGKFWFNLANAFMFTILAVLMLMHCRRSLNVVSEPKLLLLLTAFTWLGISHFGEIAIWLCGSAVYLWTGVLTAAFLLPYNLKLAGTMPKEPLFFAPLMFVTGMLAACSVENLTVTTTLLAWWMAYAAHQRQSLRPWMVCGAVGSTIGSAVCLAAPGNFVRIVDDQDRSWLFHFLNQIPANLEMIMYMLPVILTLVLAWRILCLETARRRNLSVPSAPEKRNRHVILLSFLAVGTVSFFTTGFLANSLRDLIVLTVLTPLDLTDEVTISHFANTMAGFEEAMIYILSVIYVYLMSVKNMGLDRKRIKGIAGLKRQEVIREFPQIRYGVFFILLAVFNNFVVIGAPSFPGRALFSSSVMFIIGAVVIMAIPPVKAALMDSGAGRIFRVGGTLVTAFIIVATLSVLHDIWQEDALRVGSIERQAAAGVQTAVVPPSRIPEQRRILRHVAYDDFDTGMTREHICYYFGIATVELDPSIDLDDLRTK